jgi:hypothetical protein
MSEKVFTLEEANGLLPELRRLINQAKQRWERTRALQPEIKKAHQSAQQGGGSAYGADYVREILGLKDALLGISKKGVLLKDLERGLCDFPYAVDGRIVYLCWELKEDEIEWWHEISDGYAGRQLLESLKECKEK